MDVIVVGGGISGLLSAIGLLKAGHRVRVYEQAEAITELGAGIMIPPNAAKVIEKWGLGPAVRESSVIPEAVVSYDWSNGALLGETTIGVEPYRFGSPMYQIYRPDYIEVLRNEIPSECLHLGKRVVSVVDGEDRVEVTFADGETVTGDLLIGADGIRSAVRGSVFGKDEPKFSGSVAYRTLIPADQVAHLNLRTSPVKWWGRVTQHNFVYYYVHGGDLLNVVAFTPEKDWGEESWTAKGDLDTFKSAFEDFPDPVSQIMEHIHDAPYRWAIYDREPLDSWVGSSVVLVGDAAHPMVPFMGQGAAMATEDVAVLSAVLNRVGSREVLGERLELYNSLRQKRATDIQVASRTVTIDEWHQFDELYGFDVFESVASYL